MEFSFKVFSKRAWH